MDDKRQMDALECLNWFINLSWWLKSAGDGHDLECCHCHQIVTMNTDGDLIGHLEECPVKVACEIIFEETGEIR